MLYAMKWLGIAVIFCAALSLVAMDDAVARGGGGRSSGGASRGGSHSGNHSHHNHHRSHGSFFVGFGAPLFWGPSYYYYAPGYYEPLPVYIEQNPASPEQGSQYWYYCPSARTYYPYVGECPEGWQRVLPEANPQPTNPQPPAG